MIENIFKEYESKEFGIGYYFKGLNMVTKKNKHHMKIFTGKVDNLYFNPVFVLSKKFKIIALMWLKYEIGLLY